MEKTITLFLADDDNDDAFLFAEILKEINPSIRLITAIDGEDALEKLTTKGALLPDVIFLDLNMPRMDGKECLAALKNDEKLRDIPVIMYTTSSQSRDIEETLQRGAICFITKPSSVKELREILAAISNNVHKNLEGTLQRLSNTQSTFIVC